MSFSRRWFDLYSFEIVVKAGDALLGQFRRFAVNRSQQRLPHRHVRRALSLCGLFGTIAQNLSNLLLGESAAILLGEHCQIGRWNCTIARCASHAAPVITVATGAELFVEVSSGNRPGWSSKVNIVIGRFDLFGGLCDWSGLGGLTRLIRLVGGAYSSTNCKKQCYA